MTTRYQIEYHTHNLYETPVSEAMFELLVAPCKNESQEVLSVSTTNSLGEEVFRYRNLFGFDVMRIRSTKPFTNFEFKLSSVIEKQHSNPFQRYYMSVAEEKQLLSTLEYYVDNHLFLYPTSYTQLSDAYLEQFVRPGENQAVFDYLLQLNQFIYQRFRFDKTTTHVHTTADEVAQLGMGVCQDFVHLFLAVARKHKIPCRYVSGYVNQGADLVGSAAMHAWVEALIPGNGWRGFDPTNNLLADGNHIKTAHGVDYSDCSPLKGIIKTAGDHETSYEVKVIPKQAVVAEQ